MAASHPDYPMWSALLRWSLTQTDGTDEARAPPKAMSAEDREFLAKVMKECTVDHAQRIGACLEAVAAWTAGAPGGPDAAACVAALEEIEYFIEDLDFARDLCKLGGMKVVLDALAKAGGGDVARAAAVVVAAAAQNDPPVQACVAKLKGLGSLVAAWRGDAATRRTTLAAISAVVRGNGPVEDAFAASGAAAEVVAAALGAVAGGDGSSDALRVAAKAAFLLDALACDAGPDRLAALAPAFAAAADAAAKTPASSDADDESAAAARLQLHEFLASAAKRAPPP